MCLDLILDINIFKLYLIEYKKKSYNLTIIIFIIKILKQLRFKIFPYSNKINITNIIILSKSITLFVKN